MAIPKGLFDATLVPAGWFDETTLAAGWFDADLLDAAAGGGATATLSWAEGAETSAISATAGQNITLAWTEAGDSLAANVNASQGAGLSWSENSETQSIAANVGTSSATAALAWIEQSESWTVNAAASVSAGLAWTESGDIISIAVSAGGTLSATDITAITNAVWAKNIETFHADEMLRIMFAAISGKRAGIKTATESYYAVDGVTQRITLTPDSNGNGTPTLNGGTPITPTAGSALTSVDLDNIAASVWGRVIETYSADAMLRVIFSGLAGGRSGLGGSTEHYSSVSGAKDRITFTPTDTNGNGTPVIDGTL